MGCGFNVKRLVPSKMSAYPLPWMPWMQFLRRSMPQPQRAFVALLGVLVTVALGDGPVETQAGAQLTAADVNALLSTAASALSDSTFAAAVVDRSGRILGVYARPAAVSSPAFIPDTAVSLARTGAFFSNNQAPLSSRTVRAISGIHFPAGVPNTSSAALYGIENTNRGCQLGVTDDAPLERPRSIAGSNLPSSPRLPCKPSDTSGCAKSAPITADGSSPAITNRVGVTTGKTDARDDGQPLNASVNPGGVAIYRGGVVVGGLGVAGVSPDRAEFAAFAAVGSSAGFSPLPTDPLPTPGAVFLNGIRLPFFGLTTCASGKCVGDALAQRPAGSSVGSVSNADFVVAPRAGQSAPEGYLIGPFAGANGLTVTEVTRIVDQAVAKANLTRAAIRLPLGQTARMVIGVSDQTGRLLAAFRMPDATVFSFDVAVTKARNAYYFSTREGYDVLRGFVDKSTDDKYRWEPEPPAGQGWAITNRTLSFGGQPLFPPGIDLEKKPTAGPWFELFKYDLTHPCTEGTGATRGGSLSFANQSGIVWFAGSAPLYKNGTLVGGVGVSGDGVEQDDYVTAAAVAGFEPPASLRVDQSVIRTGSGAAVRLPYWKFPRDPELK